MASTALFPSLVRDVRILLEDRIGKFLLELTDGSSDPLTSGELLSKAFKSYFLLKEKLHNDSLDCAVLALAKSGKSTLLNALCGTTLLPSNNVPETARVVALEHCQLGESEKPTLEYKVNGEILQFQGEEEIRAQLEYLNREVRGRSHKKDDEVILKVKTQLAALSDHTQDLAVGLRLLDTPGPNEAGEEALKHSVERLLDSVDAVVYVLDYTKLKTKEEAELLTKLSESNPQLIQRLAQRLFFVVNKVDVMHVTEGLDEEELREYVAELVTRQMNIPSFQLEPQQVFLVSAQDALLSRLILSEKASRKEYERFGKKAFGVWNWKKQTPEEYTDAAMNMLESSHLLELEDSLLAYLYDHAGILKVVALLDGIQKLLTQIKNVAVTGQAAMKVSADTLRVEIAELQDSLLRTSQEFLAVQCEANTVEETVVNNVRQRMLNLKTRLLKHIDEVLDPENAESILNDKQASKSHGGWAWILQKSAAFLTRQKTNPGTESDAALKARLTDLHKDVKKQIEVEITDFWHELETATNAKHKELIAVINGHLLELARRIEGSVGKVLDLALKPLDICLQKPSAEEFHNSIQDLLKNGIKRASTTTTKHRQEEHVEWQRRFRGLCNQTEYWQGVPTKKWVSYNEEKVTFDLNTESIRNHFHTMVEQSIDLSVFRVKEYVHAFMSDQIEKAHEKITSYSQLYTNTMGSALQTKSMSAAEQTESLAAIEKHLISVNTLLDEVSAIAKTVNKMFPELEMENFEWIDGDLNEDEGHQHYEAETSQQLEEPVAENSSRDLAPDNPLVEIPHTIPSAQEPPLTKEPGLSWTDEISQIPVTFAGGQILGLATASLPGNEELPKRGPSIIGALSDDESDDSYESDPAESTDHESDYMSEDVDEVYDDESEDDSTVEEVYGESDDESEEDFEDEEVNDEDEDESEDQEVEEEDSEEEEEDEEDDEEDELDSQGISQDDDSDKDAEDSVRLSDFERQLYPALAESLKISDDHKSDSDAALSALSQIPPIALTSNNVPAANEVTAVTEQTGDDKASADKAALVKDNNAASWSEHMTNFMKGLGVHGTDHSHLPLSNPELATSESTEAGHLVSPPSCSAEELLEDEQHAPLLNSSISEGPSDDWECVSETDAQKP